MDKAIEMLKKDVDKLDAIQKELARIADEFRKPVIITKESHPKIWEALEGKDACHECNGEST